MPTRGAKRRSASTSLDTTTTVAPVSSRSRLRRSAVDAVAKRASIAPFKLSPPFTFELELNSSLQAEPAMLIPGVKRVNARTVTFSATDYLEGFKLLRGLIALAAAS